MVDVKGLADGQAGVYALSWRRLRRTTIGEQVADRQNPKISGKANFPILSL